MAKKSAKKSKTVKSKLVKSTAKKSPAKKAPAKKSLPVKKKIPLKKKVVKPDFSLPKAKAFVSSIKLQKTLVRRFAAEEEKPVPYTEGIDQSLVVGSDIVSFAKELPADQRSLVVNSLLLAQLAASAKVKNSENIKDWYNNYFETLQKIGWLTQDTGFSEYEKTGSELEVHEAIIGVAMVAFGAAPTTLALVTATLNAMKKVGNNAPWMTIFKRSSEHSKVARFQVTTAESDATGGTMVSTMAFELTTTKNLTQVLFFKFSSAKVTFRYASSKITLDSKLATTLAPAIDKKVSSFLLDNIAAIAI